jgi:hypothetical protein
MAEVMPPEIINASPLPSVSPRLGTGMADGLTFIGKDVVTVDAL